MKAQGFTKETIAHLGIKKHNFPQLNIGDAVAISVRIHEGNKERLQVFEGDIIAMHKGGASSTFTVRKIGAHGVAIERIFPIHSPVVEKVKVLHHGQVRRAKLYYMRKRIGKAAHVQEKVISQQSAAQKAAALQTSKKTVSAGEVKSDVTE